MLHTPAVMCSYQHHALKLMSQWNSGGQINCYIIFTFGLPLPVF